MRTYSLITFGCQMNQHDSERIREVLRAGGYSEVDGVAEADLVLLNTCSIREKAEQKLRSEVGRLGLVKRGRPAFTIAVAGCVAQQEGERLLKKLPQIDLILGPDNIGELLSLLHDLEQGGLPRVRTQFDLEAPRFLRAEPEPGRTPPTAFVTVMKGCDERCSFCIVPHTRGPERYRPSYEIIEEIARLTDAGVREVTLLGQTVNSYRDPEGRLTAAPGAGELGWSQTHPTTARQDESEFAALLWLIAESVPKLRRLRYTSPHPRHLTRSLIRAHRELALLPRHVHLPLQSGSDAVLRRMLRRYSVSEYRERVAALRDAVPDVTLSTDVIVGFPGETPADFEQTLALVRELEFTGLFGFKYSPRPHTPALRLNGEVTEAEMSPRLAQLFALSEGMRRRYLETLVGTTQHVLVEGRGKDGRATGRTDRNEIVHFETEQELTGQIVPVRIQVAHANSLLGEPYGTISPRAATISPRRSLRVV